MSGSILIAWVNGTTFNAKADSDFSIETERDIEGIKHSGGTLKKTMLKPAMVSGIELIVNSQDIITLQNSEAQAGFYPIGFEEEDGTVWNADGFINIDSTTTQERTMSISMIPNLAWEITST